MLRDQSPAILVPEISTGLATRGPLPRCRPRLIAHTCTPRQSVLKRSEPLCVAYGPCNKSRGLPCRQLEESLAHFANGRFVGSFPCFPSSGFGLLLPDQIRSPASDP